jgi:predicted nuclease of predicted toxin-antitoxin system
VKFLFDQDVYALTEHGYDVVTASQLGLSRAQDIDLLKRSADDGPIFVTRDRDYGNLVFVHGAGSGVIYLRMLPSTIMEAVHIEMKKVLETCSETELTKAFVVVEENRHRIRRIE